MSQQPVTWNARTLAEAQDLLRAVQDRIDSSLRAAYPGIDSLERKDKGRNAPVNLQITFDPSELDRIANERSVFDAQVHDTP